MQKNIHNIPALVVLRDRRTSFSTSSLVHDNSTSNQNTRKNNIMKKINIEVQDNPARTAPPPAQAGGSPRPSTPITACSTDTHAIYIPEHRHTAHTACVTWNSFSTSMGEPSRASHCKVHAFSIQTRFPPFFRVSSTHLDEGGIEGVEGVDVALALTGVQGLEVHAQHIPPRHRACLRREQHGERKENKHKNKRKGKERKKVCCAVMDGAGCGM